MFFSNETLADQKSDLNERLLSAEIKNDDLPDSLDEKPEPAIEAADSGRSLFVDPSIDALADFLGTPSPDESKIEISQNEREKQLKELQFCLQQLSSMRRNQRPAQLCHTLFALLFIGTCGTLTTSNMIYSNAFQGFNSTIIPETGLTCNQEYPDRFCEDLFNMTSLCYEPFEKFCEGQQEARPWLIATAALFVALFAGTSCMCSLAILCLRDPTYLFGELCENIKWYDYDKFDSIVSVAHQHDIKLFNRSIDEVYKAFLRQEVELKSKLFPVSSLPSLLGFLFERCFHRRPNWKRQHRNPEPENTRLASIPLDSLNEPREEQKTMTDITTRQHNYRPTPLQTMSQPLLQPRANLSMQIFQQSRGKQVKSYEEKTRKTEDKKIASIDLDVFDNDQERLSFK